MGIDLNTYAELPKRGLFRRRPSNRALFRELRGQIEAMVRDPLERRLLSFHEEDGELGVKFHPCTEQLWFECKGDGRVRAHARTSPGGPGLHALIVDVLDHVEREQRLAWRWQDESGECTDETAYAHTRDFDALQASMLHLLQGIARHLLSRDSGGPFWVHWDLATDQPVMEAYSASPHGVLPRTWWEQVTRSDEDARRCAAEFFPWWDRTRDAAYWRKTGRLLMQSDVRWRPPEDDAERETQRLALDCLSRARQLGATTGLPEREIAELSALVGMKPSDQPPVPASVGLGYHRLPQVVRLSDTWLAEVPGYFYRRHSNDGATMEYDYGGRTFRATCVMVQPTERADGPPSASSLVESFAKDTPGPLERIMHESDGCEGAALLSYDASENCHLLRGMMMALPGAVFMTMTYTAPEDRDWAVATFRSVRRRTPPQPAPA